MTSVLISGEVGGVSLKALLVTGELCQAQRHVHESILRKGKNTPVVRYGMVSAQGGSSVALMPREGRGKSGQKTKPLN